MLTSTAECIPCCSGVEILRSQKGMGVGVSVGVGVEVGVDVGVNVAVGASVGVGVEVSVGVDVAVRVGVDEGSASAHPTTRATTMHRKNKRLRYKSILAQGLRQQRADCCPIYLTQDCAQ